MILQRAIAALEHCVSAARWARALQPFVACGAQWANNCSRGNSQNERFQEISKEELLEDRMAERNDNNNDNNSN
jgi:hypothetical protein